MKTYCVPEINLMLVNEHTPPALHLSVVIIERFGLFCGYHVMLDGRWLSRDNRRAVERLAQFLGAERAVYDNGRWLVEHFPALRHPGYVPLTEFGLTLWELDAWQRRNAAPLKHELGGLR